MVFFLSMIYEKSALLRNIPCLSEAGRLGKDAFFLLPPLVFPAGPPGFPCFFRGIAGTYEGNKQS